MDYYISDTHFGRESIIRNCERPFSSVDEMDVALNCCVEVNGFMPVTFEELVANNERWRTEG